MSQYESVYGIGLLDDIHNYFPELLYNQEAFDSPVLTYVRRQTRERFDLFSHGERQWRASLPVSSAAAAATGATGAATAAATASGFAAHRRAFSRTMATPVPSTPINSTLPTTTNADVLTTRLLLTLMSIPSGGPMGIGIGAGTGDNSFLQPVIVRPTAEEIETNTTVGHVVGDESVSCAICQDILTPEQEGRKLLGCGHWFHRGCIDTWLTRNVRCPNCRHDVRVAVTSRSE
jgi:hypothetical protein